MKTYKLLFIFTTLFLFGVNTILAFDCPLPESPSKELKRAAAVFSGKVIAEERRKITDTSDEDFGAERLFVKFKVDRLWKGTLSNEVILWTSTVFLPKTKEHSGGLIKEFAEAAHFSLGGYYFVYAYYSNGVLSAGGCEITKPLHKANEDLKELGEGYLPTAGEKCPTIFIQLPLYKDLSKDIWNYSAVIENANFKGKLTYKWTVYYGNVLAQIKSGQGTPVITIDKPNSKTEVTVEVEVGGLEKECINKQSLTRSYYF